MTYRPLRLGLGTLAASSVLAATVAASAFSVSYDQTATTQDGVVVSKVAVKGDRFRIESVIDGQRSILLRNAQGMFNYLPNEGAAIRLPRVAAGQQPVSDNYLAYLHERQATLLRSETMAGRACDVYQFTEPSGGGRVTAWVWTEQQFPIRLEIQGPQPVTVEFTNIRMGEVPPDAAFELPPGVTVTDLRAPMDLPSLMESGSRADEE